MSDYQIGRITDLGEGTAVPKKINLMAAVVASVKQHEKDAAIIAAARALVGTDREWWMFNDEGRPFCAGCIEWGADGVIEADDKHGPDCPALSLTVAVLGETP